MNLLVVELAEPPDSEGLCVILVVRVRVYRTTHLAGSTH